MAKKRDPIPGTNLKAPTPFQIPSVEVVPPPPAPESPVPEPAAREPEPSKALQALTEVGAVILFLALTAVPLARVGLIAMSPRLQVDLLVAASLALTGLLFLHKAAGYRMRAAIENLAAARRRDDAILNALAVATAVVLAVILVVEAGATMVFLGSIPRDSPAVVTAAAHFVLFSMFTLLFLDLLLIARTSFHSRNKPRGWHAGAAYTLLTIGGLLALLTVLKNHGFLTTGVLGGVSPAQSPYVLALGSFCQLWAFLWVLRFPNLAQVFRGQVEIARHATKDERVQLEKRAIRAYLLGLVFVLVSMVLLGGVATGRLSAQDSRTTNVILVFYVGAALVIFVMVLAKYLQHRFIEERSHRAEKGELIAKRRMSGEQIANLVTYGMSGTFALLLFILSILTFMSRLPIPKTYGTDILIVAFLVGVGPFGFKRAQTMARIRAMDDKFPDFLRDLAEGLRAGMTLPRALYASSRGYYGALTKEIQHMSSQVEWGVSFTESLERFANRVKTPLIQRTVSLVNEASRAGGNVVEILTAASNDAREIKTILEDRRRQMGIYSVIIYVAFLVFLVVIWVLADQFLPSFQDAVKGASGQQVGGLNFAPFETETYVSVFFHAGLIQGIGGGLVAGVMTDGHPLGGLKHSFIMTIMCWVFFRGLL